MPEEPIATPRQPEEAAPDGREPSQQGAAGDRRPDQGGQGPRDDQERSEAPAPEDRRKGKGPGKGGEPGPGGDARTENLSAQLGDPDRDQGAREAQDEQQRANNNVTGETNFLGSVSIGGDLRVERIGRRARPVTGPVGDEELEYLRAVYTPPPCYQRVRDAVRKRRIVVLRGRPGWGKATLALHLLDELVTGDGHREREVRRLDPDVDVRSLRDEDFKPGWGYVIDTVAPGPAGRLNAFQLPRLGAVLKKRAAWLVLTVSDQVELPADLPDDYEVDCADPSDDDEALPHRLGMLERHLRHRLDGSAAASRVGDLLASEGVRRCLAARPPAREVAHLAELLAEAVDGPVEPERTLEQRVAEALGRFEARGQQAAERWFNDHRRPREQAFKLALAVFNGGTYQSALDAAAELEPLLRPKRKRSSAGWPLFDGSRKERLAQVGAQVDVRFERISIGWTRFEPINVGWTRSERVQLHNTRLPAALLELIWHQHDRAREPLLRWLDGLAGRDDAETRARAAAAAGKLSTYGFRHVYNRLIVEWASSDEPRRRESAAWALGVPAGDAELAPVVLAVLRRWIARKSAPELKHAAAVAYGASTGLLFPEAALQGLRRIANADIAGLDLAVADSMANLFEAGHHDLVLRALEEWTDPSRPAAAGRARCGAVAYLKLAFTARVDPVPEGDAWPALLALAERDKGLRAMTITLWGRTLDLGAPFGDTAMDAWRRWVRLADKDRRLLDLLRPVVAGLARRPRHREQLRSGLRKLADDARKPSPTAQDLLRVLDHWEERDAGTQEATQALQRPDPVTA